jgi:hypothetical protein
VTGDPEFLDKAALQIGAPDFAGLVGRLEGSGLQNLENRAALLALVQRMTGRL